MFPRITLGLRFLLLTAFATPGASAAVDPGEILLSEMNCAACHEAAEPVKSRLASRQSPRLGKDGVRISPAHLRAFLENPVATKPGTLMPDMLHGLEPVKKAEVAEALTHYLISLQTPDRAIQPAASTTTIATGNKLYHTLGCVQCHAPHELPSNAAKRANAQSDFEQLQQSSVPLGRLAEKYTVTELAVFLKDPLRVRPAGRMPSLSLDDAEARAIAMYLLREQIPADATAEGKAMALIGAVPFVVDPSKAAQGAHHYARFQCANCHGMLPATGPLDALTPSAKPLARLRARQPAGCLATRQSDRVPKFEISDRQRVVLLAILQNQAALAEPLEPASAIKRTMTTLNCYACHQRDRRGGPEGLRREYFTSTTGADLGDEGRLAPNLNVIGAKLRPEWTRDVLTRGTSLRPYMVTRMPLFGPASVHELPALFEKADARVDALPEPDVSTPEMAILANDAGRKLIGSGGLNCISCHDFAGKKSIGAPGIDLALSARRLKWDWFHRCLLDPALLRSGTRMPEFWPKGIATKKDLPGTDGEEQILAIWTYLAREDFSSLPPGLGK